MNVEPLGDRVLILMKKKGKTEGGLLLPDGATPVEPGKGIVKAVGPGQWNQAGTELIPMRVKVGELVLLPVSMYAELTFKIDGEPHVLVGEQQILARITENGEGDRNGT